ncbi:MAG: hypothetical protein P8175_12255 [Deltaproteobacteria bacterium]
MCDLTFIEYDDLTPRDVVDVLQREKRVMFGTGHPSASLRSEGPMLLFSLPQKRRRSRQLLRGWGRLLNRMRTSLQKAS